MQNRIYDIDQGTDFGRWLDPVSQLMYYESTYEIMKKIHIPERVADYGGANGNLKEFIPHSISIDIDPTKEPDIIDDIMTHKGEYDLIVIRYVLHYLTDDEVEELLTHIKSFHKGRILIIQFTNEDLATKYLNSRNEGKKFFRTFDGLRRVLPDAILIYDLSYNVDERFYENRLKIADAVPHEESLQAYLIE